jgi:hypothetical protein
MSDEKRELINPLEVNDVIYPFIFRVQGIRISPICLFKHENGNTYTTALPAENYCPRENKVPRGIKYFGWATHRGRPHGVKVFVDCSRSALETDEAIRIIHIFRKSAMGEIVKFRIK